MSRQSILADSRRQFLASLATLAGSGALAGCSGLSDVTTQEFEASPVGLPEEAQRELAMTETFADSRTVSREGSAMGVEGEVTVTNYAAAYRRDIDVLDRTSERRPTLIDSFVDRVNGRGDGGSNRAASIAAAADLGVDEVTLPVFEEAPAIRGDAFSLLVPEGVRGGGEGETATPFDDILCVAPISSSLLGVDEVTLGIPNTYQTTVKDVLPPAFWEDGVLSPEAGDKSPDARSVLARWGVPDSDTFWSDAPTMDGPVLVVLGEDGLEEGWSPDTEALPGERVEEGTTFDTGNNPFLLVASGGIDKWLLWDEIYWSPKVFDVARPAAMGGVSAGLGVISTPNEQLGGQSVSPLAEMPLEDVLSSDQAREMVPVHFNTIQSADPEGGEDQEVEWLAGPREFRSVGGQSPFTILDEETELETFVGIASGEDGPWLTFVHVARAAGDDVVIVVGSHSTPVGERTDVGSGRGFDSAYGPWAARGGGFTTVAGERLSPGVPDYDG